MIIGVTDEAPELVDQWVQDYEVEYPVVILKDGAFEKTLGVQFFPTAAVMAPDNEVVYSGSAGSYSGPLKKAMGKAKKGSLWPKSVDKAFSKWQAGDPGQGYHAITKLLDSKNTKDNDRYWADKFKVYMEAEADRILKESRKFVDDGLFYQATLNTESHLDTKEPLPWAEGFQKLVDEMESDPLYSKEISGGKIHAKGLIADQERAYLDAFKAYKGVYKKYPNTRIGAASLTRATEIKEKGLPGYEPSCRHCRQAKRACAKHLVKVKI